jgi:hypothetical protein
MSKESHEKELQKAIKIIAERCPRLRESCYWAGTSAIAVEELHHRQSFDIDLHTKTALQDVRPLLAEIQRAFPNEVEISQAPDAYGSGFRVVVAISGIEGVTLEVLSNFQNVPDEQLVESRTAKGLQRLSLRKYIEDKIQCLVERTEARDLIDIHAVMQYRPELEQVMKTIVSRQDLLLLSERLLGWTESDLRADLAAYHDVNAGDAMTMRDLLLVWIKGLAR